MACSRDGGTTLQAPTDASLSQAARPKQERGKAMDGAAVDVEQEGGEYVFAFSALPTETNPSSITLRYRSGTQRRRH